MGLDFSTSTGASSQTVVAIAYLQCLAGSVIDNYNTLVFYGAVSSSSSNVNGTISSGQVNEVGRATFTVARLHGRNNTYSVGVRLDGYTVGTPSATKSGYVPAAGYNAPERPYLYVTRQSDSRVAISWEATSTAAAPVHGFNLEQREDTGPWRRIMDTADGTLSGWTDTSVSAGHVYGYRLRAVGPGGQSDWNTYAALYMTPNPPASVVATREGNAVVVTWVNAGVGDYETHVWQGDTTAGGANISGPLKPGVTTFRVTGLDTTKEYVFRVGHVTPSGLTASTLSNTVRLLAAPLAPTNLTPNGGWAVSGTSTTFTWDHNPTDGTPQSKYELQYRASGNTSWLGAGIKTSTASIESVYLSTSREWEWRVRTWGQDPNKPSPWSNIATVNTQWRPAASFIAPASGAVLTTDRAEFTFSSSRYPASYVLELSAPGMETQVLQGYGDKQFTQTVHGLPNNTTVTARLVVNNKVESAPVTRTFTVKYAAPAPPTTSAHWMKGNTGMVGVQGFSRDGAVETDHVNIYRKNTDGSLTLLGVLPPFSYSQIPDPVPPLTGATYVAEAVSATGTTTKVTSTVGPAPAPATYLNWGPGLGRVLRFRYNPTIRVQAGRATVTQEFAGHALPRVVFTDRVSRQVDIGGTIAGFYAGDTDSTPDEEAKLLLDDLAVTDTPVVLRLAAGDVYEGYVTGVTASRDLWGGWQASLSFVEAEHA